MNQISKLSKISKTINFTFTKFDTIDFLPIKKRGK